MFIRSVLLIMCLTLAASLAKEKRIDFTINGSEVKEDNLLRISGKQDATLLEGGLLKKDATSLLNELEDGLRKLDTATFDFCVRVDWEKIDLHNTVCTTVSFLPAPVYGISLTISLDKKVIIKKTISARNPPPVCVDVPYLKKYASLCLRFYNISFTNRKLSSCAEFEARLEGIKVGKLNLGCFKIPSSRNLMHYGQKGPVGGDIGVNLDGRYGWKGLARDDPGVILERGYGQKLATGMAGKLGGLKGDNYGEDKFYFKSMRKVKEDNLLRILGKQDATLLEGGLLKKDATSLLNELEDGLRKHVTAKLQCCVHVDWEKIELNKTVCTTVSFLPAPVYGISLTISLDYKVIINITISARNPPPVCVGVPYLKKYASLCLRFYNISFTNRKLSSCAEFEARLEGFKVGKLNLGCFKIPSSRNLVHYGQKGPVGGDLGVNLDGRYGWKGLARDDAGVILERGYGQKLATGMAGKLGGLKGDNYGEDKLYFKSMRKVKEDNLLRILGKQDATLLEGGLLKKDSTSLLNELEDGLRKLDTATLQHESADGLVQHIQQDTNVVLNSTVDGLLKSVEGSAQANLRSCACLKNHCGCCVHVDWDKIHLDNTVCANFSYLPAPVYGISMTLSLDNKVIINETIPARNPPPVCAAIPYLKKFASLCLRFYNISFTESTLSSCVELDAILFKLKVETLHLGCFKIPPSRNLMHYGKKGPVGGDLGVNLDGRYGWKGLARDDLGVSLDKGYGQKLVTGMAGKLGGLKGDNYGEDKLYFKAMRKVLGNTFGKRWQL